MREASFSPDFRVYVQGWCGENKIRLTSWNILQDADRNFNRLDWYPTNNIKQPIQQQQQSIQYSTLICHPNRRQGRALILDFLACQRNTRDAMREARFALHQSFSVVVLCVVL
jgi:hypothetical protein